MRVYPTEVQLEETLESALRHAMSQEQAVITINRYLYGDLTEREGIDELVYQRRLIASWQLGNPSPFGEIE